MIARRQTYAKENLLEKFIRNERNSKLWALLALLLFFGASGAVIMIAKNVKGSAQTITVRDTLNNNIIDTVKDAGDSVTIDNLTKQIFLLTDSLNDARTQYETQIKEVNKYIQLWNDCKDKQTSTPPTTVKPSLNVVIRARNSATDALQKIESLIHSAEDTKYNVTVTTQTSTTSTVNPPTNNGKLTTITKIRETAKLYMRSQQYFVGVRYADINYASDALTIASALNNNRSTFTSWTTLGTVQGATASANIEVWLDRVTIYRIN